MKIKRFNESENVKNENFRVSTSIDLSLSKEEIISLVSDILIERDEYDEKVENILGNLSQAQAQVIIDSYFTHLLKQVAHVNVIDFNVTIYDILVKM